MIQERLRKERAETEKAKLEAFSVMCKKNADLEKENKKLRKQLDRVIWLIQNIIHVTWGEGWSYSLGWKAEAEKFLGELGE